MKNLPIEWQLQFKEYFGVSTVKFIDELVTVIIGAYSFNIIEFNNWLENTKGYDIDKHGSIKDFLKSNFDPGADDLIQSILNFK